jgi:hypothetical protein
MPLTPQQELQCTALDAAIDLFHDIMKFSDALAQADYAGTVGILEGMYEDIQAHAELDTHIFKTEDRMPSYKKALLERLQQHQQKEEQAIALLLEQITRAAPVSFINMRDAALTLAYAADRMQAVQVLQDVIERAMGDLEIAGNLEVYIDEGIKDCADASRSREGSFLLSTSLLTLAWELRQIVIIPA